MSKLKKEEVKFIDDYLRENGVSYWDIRLEMIDHIACNMESKTGHYDFEPFFMETVYKLGWCGGLKDYEERQLKVINKTIRNKYFKTLGGAFKSFKSLLLIGVFIFFYYFLFQSLSSRIFAVLSFVLIGAPLIFFTGHYAYKTLKNKTSGYLFYGYFYIIFSLLMSNLFYQIPRPDGIIEVSIETRQNIIFFTTIFNVLFIYSGIKVYLQINQQYNKIDETLTSN